ncbi:MAG: CotH kinase family protein [Clostridia bacterium]|nr:CotH kinase family protein [Clostridia bacterium]
MRKATIVWTAAVLLLLGAAAARGEEALCRLPLLPADQTPAAPAGAVLLTAGGRPLAYDAAANTYYIPAGEDQSLPAEITLDLPAGGRGWITERGEDGAFDVYAFVDNGWQMSHAVATALPVLAIDTEAGDLPSDETAGGSLRLFERAADGALRVTASPLTIRLRGNTSRRFPKKSYRVTMVNERGKKQNVSIAGLRSDDDWILNPLYADSSKIREAVSYWLWETINSSGQAAASSRLRYAEVVLNGEYYGLYGVQERVDRKQVGADRQQDILYKVAANRQPEVEELLAWAGDEPCQGIELAFAGSRVLSPWAPAADYMAALTSASSPGNARFDRANVIDYGLWSMLTQARDCHFKNQFIHGQWTAAGYILYHMPWDLNHTLGDLWAGSAEAENYTSYEMLPLVTDDLFQAVFDQNDPAFRQALKARWTALRHGDVTEEAILGYARGLFEALYPAIARDSLRWPSCGMGEGNAANIRDIEDYIRQALPRIDAWVDALETEEERHGQDLDR